MKNIFYSLLILSAGLCSCSDSFLEREPEGAYVDATFYTSDVALEAATAPLYNRAWFDYNKRPAVAIGSLRANDSYNPWMNPEFVTFQVTALNSNLSDTWKSFYGVVTMANSVIDAVNTKTSGTVTEGAKKIAIAESRLMRGIAYYYLLELWGPVILIENNQAVVDNPVMPLNREEDVFRFIINDLTYAMNNLPSSWKKGRATSWAAKGFLAKVYLTRSGWKKGGTRDEADLDKAKELAGEVCTQSGLNLLQNYEDLFKYKFNNNEESLLAMQWVPLGDWGVCNTLLADLAFSSEVTGGVNVWGGGLNGSIDMLQQYEVGDTIRRNATFFTQGSFYPYICISDSGYRYTGTASPIKKGVIGGPDDENDGKIQSMNSPLNTYIIRLADVYLTYAEACLGNSAALSAGPGLVYFNKVRARAKVPSKESITLDDIIREKRVEFAMEYTNWYDLVNWYCYKPDKMLAYLNAQQRGWRAENITKDVNGNLVFDTLTEPEVDILITKENMFLPYPESDVIQNPLLNDEPQPYNFNE